MKIALFAFAMVFLGACAHHTGTESSASQINQLLYPTVGPWTNPFKGDPRLAGVVVSQLPENPYIQRAWVGKHPCMIEFYFWDERVQQRDYEPDGKQTDCFWWPPTIKVNEGLWEQVDFSQGSDPTFRHHADPRKQPEARSA